MLIGLSFTVYRFARGYVIDCIPDVYINNDVSVVPRSIRRSAGHPSHWTHVSRSDVVIGPRYGVILSKILRV
jgi:hypothetical protein